MSNSRQNLSVTRSDLWKPKFSQIIADPKKNVRYDYGDLEELSRSIEVNGVIKTVSGYRKGDQFFLTDGFRRYFAAKLLYDRKKIDVEFQFQGEPKGGYSETDRRINMLIHAEGKPLTMLEQAMQIKLLIEEDKMSEAEIARRLGKSRAHINKVNELNKAPEKLVELVKSGEISGTAAVKQIVKGTVDKFLDDYDKGLYNPTEEEEDDGPDGQESAGSGKGHKKGKAPLKIRTVRTQHTSRIKPGDIDKTSGGEPTINSMKLWRAFLKDYEGKPKDPVSQKIMSWGVKLSNNELTEADFKKTFKS